MKIDTISKLLNALDHLKISYDYNCTRNTLRLNFCMGAYVLYDMNCKRVIEWVDVQEWAKSYSGMILQVNKKISLKG